MKDNFNEILFDALKRFNRKTNADRIRSMSDEELAEALYMGCGDRDRNSHTCKISEKYDALEILYMSEEEEDALCIQCWLDWLKQEVDE